MLKYGLMIDLPYEASYILAWTLNFQGLKTKSLLMSNLVKSSFKMSTIWQYSEELLNSGLDDRRSFRKFYRKHKVCTVISFVGCQKVGVCFVPIIFTLQKVDAQTYVL